jgi:hypothetical protein
VKAVEEPEELAGVVIMMEGLEAMALLEELRPSLVVLQGPLYQPQEAPEVAAALVATLLRAAMPGVTAWNFMVKQVLIPAMAVMEAL